MNHKQGDVVLPGEVLCTYEEFIPSDWTYVEDGYIKASIFGYLKVDDMNKEISIVADNAPEHIKVGDRIIGHVTEVKQYKALITVKKIVGNNRDIVAGYKGYIHISHATDEYVCSMHELFKIGDIIEAEVINKIGSEFIELTTADDDLGIIKAMCVFCRKFMKLAGDKLVCECEHSTTRKLSSNYGRILDENY